MVLDLTTVILRYRHDLDDFDFELVGMDCVLEHAHDDPVWSCPFQPGCGSRTPLECPMRARRALIVQAPRRLQ